MPYVAIPITHLSSLSSTFPPPLPKAISSPLLPFIFILFSFFSPFCTRNESKSQKTPQRKSQPLSSFCHFFLFLPFSITGPTVVGRFAGRSPSAIHCQRPTYPSFPSSILSTFPTFSLFLSHFLTTQTLLFFLSSSLHNHCIYIFKSSKSE